MSEIHPEEYRHRVAEFHRSTADIIEQRILINTLWPKPITFEYEGKQVVAIIKERPKEIEELDAYLELALNRAFKEIVIREPLTVSKGGRNDE